MHHSSRKIRKGADIAFVFLIQPLARAAATEQHNYIIVVTLASPKRALLSTRPGQEHRDTMEPSCHLQTEPSEEKVWKVEELQGPRPSCDCCPHWRGKFCWRRRCCQLCAERLYLIHPPTYICFAQKVLLVPDCEQPVAPGVGGSDK